MTNSLNHYAPNQTKTLLNALIHKTRFRNKYLENKTDENKRKYIKQCNYCVSLFRKSNKEYYGNLDVKNINHHKTVWGNHRRRGKQRELSIYF